MRLYETARGNWAGTQDEARRQAKADGSEGKFYQVDVPSAKAELLDWLNENFGEHQDPPRRGDAPSPFASSAGETPSAVTDEFAFRRELDERWPSLPLPYRLDLAALSLDEARSQLPPPPEQERTH